MKSAHLIFILGGAGQAKRNGGTASDAAVGWIVLESWQA